MALGRGRYKLGKALYIKVSDEYDDKYDLYILIYLSPLTIVQPINNKPVVYLEQKGQ